MGEAEKAEKELQELKQEHKELDEKIEEITLEGNYNQLEVQRLKKRKLQLKDRITTLQEFLCDDIIA